MSSQDRRSFYIILILLLAASGLVLVWSLWNPGRGASGLLVGIAIAFVAPLAGILYRMSKKN